MFFNASVSMTTEEAVNEIKWSEILFQSSVRKTFHIPTGFQNFF